MLIGGNPCHLVLWGKDEKVKVLINILKHFEELVGCLFLLAVVGLTIMNVILRYFFGFIIAWAEEVTLLCFLWCIYMGVITAFRGDSHVAIDAVVKLLPKKAQTVIGYGVDILILILSIFMTYLGIILVSHVGLKTTNVLRLSYVYVNMSVVVSFGLVSVFGIVKLVRRITGKYEYVDALTRTINEISEKTE